MEERAQILAAAASMIADAGYITTPDEDGDLVFRIEGVRGYFQCFDNDDSYARIWIPFGLRPDVDIDKAIRVANRLTRKTKSVKFTVGRDTRDLMVSVECFFEDVEHLRRPIPRILNALVRGDVDFFEQLEQPEPALEMKANV